MKVAAIQMVSSPNAIENMTIAKKLITQAREHGASLVALPEYWPVMGMRDTDKVEQAEVSGSGPIQDFLSSLAKQLEVTIVAGTIPIASEIAHKIFNSTLVFDPTGQVVARYDKMHLFGFNNGEESYQESNTIAPGAQVTTFQAPIGRVGLSICYDLRFPELFRAMGSCALIIVPAAFTYTTGQAHWEILLRARAIENQCYVLASAQGGTHANNRRTWGHSMLIDPWGKIVAQLEEGEGFVVGEVDVEVMRTIRSNLPALQHRLL